MPATASSGWHEQRHECMPFAKTTATRRLTSAVRLAYYRPLGALASPLLGLVGQRRLGGRKQPLTFEARTAVFADLSHPVASNDL